MHTAVDDPLVGRLLEGRYLIQAPLARGGMSMVYTANDQRLDRLVAVKVMSPALTSDPNFTDRFIREARAAARMTHVNAVAVFDQGDEAGPNGRIVFLVMELISGRTLRELLRERGRLSPAEALSIIEPVLAALAAAHRAGLIHRDIKPENILISDEGVVKVADFGLARAIESDGNSTSTGIMMGTVAYCSPEQITRGRTDARSDVYAAGIVLFELLTGTPPYVGDSAVTVAFQHVHNRVPAPSERVRGIDPRLDELVLRATDSDPAGRPIDAGAFLAEMHDVRTDLDLPVVVVAGLGPSTKAKANGTRANAGPRNQQAVTTPRVDQNPTGPVSRTSMRTAMHNTLAVGPREVVDDYYDDGPPPPVVIPPPKPRKQRSVRYRRRRRFLIGLVVLILVGGSVGYASWWYGTGRFSQVPALGGQTPTTATAALKQAGFTVADGTQTQFSDTVEKGLVIGTEPPAGKQVTRGHTISLVVSKGKDLVAVPTVVIGSTVEEARALLGNVPIELVAATTSEPSDTIAAGKVLGTNPSGATNVARGAQVRLIVSSGPPVLTVPDITNKTQAVASDTLKQLGYAVTVATEYSPVIKAGIVMSQTPAANASLAKFQPVTIVVSKGPAPVAVPNVIGQQISVAKTKMTDLGLVVKVMSVPFASLNNVVTMDPNPGTVVPYGSTVTLYIN